MPYQGQISAGEAGGGIRAEARTGLYSLTLPIAPLVVCPDGAGLSVPSKNPWSVGDVNGPASVIDGRILDSIFKSMLCVLLQAHQ
jgi:hypothetical protein